MLRLVKTAPYQKSLKVPKNTSNKKATPVVHFLFPFFKLTSVLCSFRGKMHAFLYKHSLHLEVYYMSQWEQKALLVDRTP